MPFTLFLDDSDRARSADQPGSGIFGMGGVLVPSSEVCGLERDIDVLAIETFGAPSEIKWHMPKSSAPKLDALRKAMFATLVRHRCISIVALIYDVRGENSSVGRDRMRSYAFEACLQRAQIHVGRSKEAGPHVVIVDTPPDGPKRLHEKYTVAYRTANALPSGKLLAAAGKDSGFVSALLISDATRCLGLQAADTTVGCVVSWAKAELTSLQSNDSNPKGLAFARQYMAQWLPLAAKGPNGEVLGYGLARWPREVNLLNLAIEKGLAVLGMPAVAQARTTSASTSTD